MGSILFWLLVVVVAVSFYLITKKQKAIQNLKDKQVSLNHSARLLQERYKQTIAQINELGILEAEGKRRLVALVNNYFVFQPINQVNLSHLSDLVDLFVEPINRYFETHVEASEQLTELLLTLGNHLPEDTRSYSAEFYLNRAPSLLYDFSMQVENLSTHHLGEDEQEVLDEELLNQDPATDDIEPPKTPN